MELFLMHNFPQPSDLPGLQSGEHSRPDTAVDYNALAGDEALDSIEISQAKTMKTESEKKKGGKEEKTREAAPVTGINGKEDKAEERKKTVPPWQPYYDADNRKSLVVLNLADEKIVKVNEAACTLFGYPARILVGMDYSALLTRNAQPLFRKQKAQIENATAGAGPFEMSTQVHNVHNRPVYVNLLVYPMLFRRKKYALLMVKNVLGENLLNQLRYQLDNHKISGEQRNDLTGTILKDIAPQMAPSILPAQTALPELPEIKYPPGAAGIRPMVELLLHQLEPYGGYTSATVFLVEEDILKPAKIYGRLANYEDIPFHLTLCNINSVEETLQRRGLVVIPDLNSHPEAQQAIEEWQTESNNFYSYPINSWLAVPLINHNRLEGVLSVGHIEPGTYDRGSLSKFYKSLSLVNSAREQLYSRFHGLGVVDERERIARELHDSIKQIFFVIQLSGTTLKALLEAPQDPAQRQRDNTQLLQLADDIVNMASTGMTELQALLLELQPETLEKMGLVASLRSLLQMVETHYALKAEAKMDTEPDLPLKNKEGLYRIAQEALNNTAKHARANHVTITLNTEPVFKRVSLVVEDDGQGFDPNGFFPGHMGLDNMNERAHELGGKMEVVSSLGQGTKIIVTIPLP